MGAKGMLIEKHVLVHLSNGQIWSSLHDTTELHDELLTKVDLHMVYLGTGNFALLQNRINPLQIVHTSPDVESTVVGTFVPLSADENKCSMRYM